MYRCHDVWDRFSELGFPTITVNHVVAEEWGIANLARYLQDTFPELDVFALPQQCPYRLGGG